MLPLAALTAFVLATRGRPWHGAVAATLGFYLAQAGWALLAEGTRGFQRVVEAPSWWAPTAAFAAITVATGVPAIRSLLIGGPAWNRARSRQSAIQNTKDASAPAPTRWQTSLIDGALTGQPDCVGASMVDLIPGKRPFGNDLTRHVASSREHSVTGPLGQARTALDQCLDTIQRSFETDIQLCERDWTALLAINPTDGAANRADGGHGANGAGPLDVNDRAELVRRAATHSAAASLALGWIWFSGIEQVVEALGTEEQKRSLTSAVPRQGEVVAAGWSGIPHHASTAIVTRGDHDGEEVIGLSVTYDVENVVGAGAASAVALMVETSDPDGILSEDPEASPSLGLTCILLRPTSGLSLLGGSLAAERLGSHAITGRIQGEGIFLGPDQILGGQAGIGAASAVAEGPVQSWETVRTTAVLAGLGQNDVAMRGSGAIIRNVVNGETVEAWEHADLGASALRMNALSKVSTRVALSRDFHPSEALAIGAAAQRCAAELHPTTGLEDFILSLPKQGGAAAAGDVDWLPSWHLDAAAAAASSARTTFNRAHSRGLRYIIAIAATSLRDRMVSRKSGKQGEADGERLNATSNAIARAYASVRTCALRSGCDSVEVQTRLRFVEERLTTWAFLALADQANGAQLVDQGLFRFAALTELSGAYTELLSAINRLPGPLDRFLCRRTLAAAKAVAHGPSPALAEAAAAALVANPEMLRRLTDEAYHGHAENGGSGPLRQASRLAAASRVPVGAVQRAQAIGQLPSDDGDFDSVLTLAVERRIISGADATRIRSCMAVASEYISDPTPLGPTENVVRQTA